MCPRWLYLIPALMLTGIGLALMVWLTPGPRHIGDVGFDWHTMLYGCLCLILGYQTTWLWAFARSYGRSSGLLSGRQASRGWSAYFTLERGLGVGMAKLAGGLGMNAWLCTVWWERPPELLDPQATMRYALWSSTLMILGMQTIYGSFFLGMLGMQRTPDEADARRVPA